MLRLHPTTIYLALPEIKDFDTRTRYRRYLKFNEPTFRGPPRPNADAKGTRTEVSSASNSETPALQLETEVGRSLLSGLLKACPVSIRGPSTERSPGRDTMTLELQSTSLGDVDHRPPLPAPFSTTTRTPSAASPSNAVNNVSAEPERFYTPSPQLRRPATSRKESPSASLRRARVSGEQSTGGRRPSAAQLVMSEIGSSGCAGGYSELVSSSPPEPSLPCRQARAVSLDNSSVTPAILVYNDSLPASSQPQTPRNLPEARHRSRFDGLFTAPISRVLTESASISVPTSGRRRLGRTGSPEGIRTPGFQGLYGGIENSDDALLLEGEVRRRGTMATDQESGDGER